MIVIGVAAVVGLLMGCACRVRSNLRSEALVVPVLVAAALLVLSSDNPLAIVAVTLVGAYTATLARSGHPRHSHRHA